jgi:hypothetical protein
MDHNHFGGVELTPVFHRICDGLTNREQDVVYLGWLDSNVVEPVRQSVARGGDMFRRSTELHSKGVLVSVTIWV